MNGLRNRSKVQSDVKGNVYTHWTHGAEKKAGFFSVVENGTCVNENGTLN